MGSEIQGKELKHIEAMQQAQICTSEWQYQDRTSAFYISVTYCQFSSVTHSCPTLCSPMDYSMPGFPVHHQFPELAQTHVHRKNLIGCPNSMWTCHLFSPKRIVFSEKLIVFTLNE